MLRMGVVDEGVRFTLRISEQLRESLHKSANDNHRSLNSEIVAILESRKHSNARSKSALIKELNSSCQKLSEDSIQLLVDLSRRMGS
ncbi:MAG: Arc family DNA-binding protein [Candidatus Marinimicrobia bacterium]|nr:Arc family DNA-binding protein [Candidatus Neomarinimicrobiota bacterium]